MRMTTGARIFWTRCAMLLAALLCWEVYARLWADTRFVSPPSLVLHAAIFELFREPGVIDALVTSLWILVVAYALAILFGIVVGLAVGWSSFGRKAFFPVVLLLYGIPQVILLPLFVLIFGIGPACKIAFGLSHGFFPIAVNVISGMKNINILYLRSGHSLGASSFDIARYIYLPNMLQSLFTGLRLGMTLTLLGVVLAELYVSTQGIGYWTKLYAETHDPAPLFALIAILALMAVILNELVRAIERRGLRWRG